MKVGYVRCSTAEQNEARQLKMMEEQGVEKILLGKVGWSNAVNRKSNSRCAAINILGGSP